MLNLQYRGMDKTTDVLSFPQLSIEDLRSKTRGSNYKSSELRILEDYSLPLGDIVINLHRAQRQAEENGVSFNEELKRLLIHGLLHLIGHDHEKNRYAERKMQGKAKELYKALGLQLRHNKKPKR
jgi:probable rRNA maturation factor